MKIVVLNSGGIDSTTCVSIAINKYGKENVSTVSVFYGQKLKKELKCAEEIAKYYGIEHYVLDLSQVFKYSNCTLLEHSTEEVKKESYTEQCQEEEIISSYVPFRNGLMISAIASFAIGKYPNEQVIIMLGNHKSDFAYADCSTEFTKKMSEAILQGTYNKVSLESPLIELTKTEVVKKGLELGTPYSLTWSCYEGRDKACGKCASCIDRLEAFANNNCRDEVEYE